MTTGVAERVDDELWSAIGDPTRRRMIDLLLVDGHGTATSLLHLEKDESKLQAEDKLSIEADSIEITANRSLKLKAASIEIAADADVTVKGSVIKLN